MSAAQLAPSLKNMGFGGRTGFHKKIIDVQVGGGGTGHKPPGHVHRGGGGVPYLHFWAEIGNRAGGPSAEGSQFQLHPSGSAGWTLSGEDLGKFGLEKAILGYLRPF